MSKNFYCNSLQGPTQADKISEKHLGCRGNDKGFPWVKTNCCKKFPKMILKEILTTFKEQQIIFKGLQAIFRHELIPLSTYH